MSLNRSVRPSLGSALAAVVLAGCIWPADHDAGDEAFAVQALDTVLGRKPHGAAEVRALADLAAVEGREAVLDRLFAEPDYVTYWSNVLLDHLQLQRAGAMRVNGDCTAPAILDPVFSESLADFVAEADPDSKYCGQVEYHPPPPWDPIEYGVVAERSAAKALDAYGYTTPDTFGTPGPLKEVPALAWPDDKFPVGFTEFGDLNLTPYGDLGPVQFPLQIPPELLKVGLSEYFTPERLSELQIQQDEGTWSCVPFNLTDVAEAAVRADRLDALYRAYLPVLASFPATLDDPAKQEGELGARFLEVYLDRDPTCMTCHTTTYSRTDPKPRNGNWDRFFPVGAHGVTVPVDLEGSAFTVDGHGNVFRYGGDGGTRVHDQVAALFRGDNHASSGGVAPWGMDDTCVTNPPAKFAGYSRSLAPDGQLAAFAGVQGDDRGVFDLVRAFSDGIATLDQVAFTVPPWHANRTGWGATPVAQGCAGCHGPMPSAPPLAHAAAQMSDDRLFSVIRFGAGTMPAVAGTDQDAWNAVAWVRQTYPASPALQMVDRDHAFVHLVATNAVNQIVDEAMGEDLVMPHGFPRNPQQAEVLSELTGELLGRWSLQDVLRRIVLSPGFNRLPPSDPGTTPYNLPMLPVPEAAVAPTGAVVTGANANSEGDYVHKASPAALFRRVHAALGWPDVTVGGNATAYPTRASMSDVGRYTSVAQPESDQYSLATYLSWESQVATCRKPAFVFARDVHLAPGSTKRDFDLAFTWEWVDWIDVLAADASARGTSYEALAIAIKDRLLADPTLSAAEAAAIADLWQVPDLSGTPASFTLQETLRAYCGVLLASPQFLLTGMPTNEALPATLPDPVCLPDEPCGASDWADYYTR